MNELPPIPRLIAIVGRPNVGKSAIFNRLAGRRMAIVHEEVGVTRDRVASEAHWNDERFVLMDTGGLGTIDSSTVPDSIEKETYRQAEIAIQDAAVLLFVVDITAGITPLDRNVAALLRKHKRPTFLLANKADNAPLEDQAPEFLPLGFPVFPVAALHNRGFETLMEQVVKALPAAPPPESITPLKVAVVGRPNAGKSSFINRLLRSDRVIVSPIAGTTRDSVEIPFKVGSGPQARNYLLIDTAGLRPSSKVDNPVERYSVMRAEATIERADVVVLIMDAEEGPSTQDKKIAAKILEANRGCIIFVNKWDLAGKITQREYEKALRLALPFLAFVPIVFASAKSGYNVRRVVDLVDHVAAQQSMQLPTGALNRVLHQLFDRLQPPMVKGKRMKLYYAAQTGTRPVRVRLFVNDTDRMTPAYRQYLISRLREAYGLEGAPVVIDLRSSHGRADGSAPKN